MPAAVPLTETEPTPDQTSLPRENAIGADATFSGIPPKPEEVQDYVQDTYASITTTTDDVPVSQSGSKGHSSSHDGSPKPATVSGGKPKLRSHHPSSAAASNSSGNDSSVPTETSGSLRTGKQTTHKSSKSTSWTSAGLAKVAACVAGGLSLLGLSWIWWNNSSESYVDKTINTVSNLSTTQKIALGAAVAAVPLAAGLASKCRRKDTTSSKTDINECLNSVKDRVESVLAPITGKKDSLSNRSTLLVWQHSCRFGATVGVMSLLLPEPSA